MTSLKHRFRLSRIAFLILPFTVIGLFTLQFLTAPSSMNESPRLYVSPLQTESAAGFQAVTDRTTELGAEEMPTYWRLMSASQQDLSDNACTPTTFEDLVENPNQLRGVPVAVELNVRRILAYDAPQNSLGVSQLYEVWGSSTESPGRLFVGVTAKLPAEMPVGPSVQARARFYGYFFKLQGYYPAMVDTQSPPMIAPLLIGRIVHSEGPQVVLATQREWWQIGLGSLLLVSLAVSLRGRSRRSSEPTGLTVHRCPVDTSQLDEWLADQAPASAAHS